jgi:hypothetical protein
MRAQRLFPIALSVVLSILMMACKDDPVTPSGPDAAALKGTWIMETADGQNVIDDAGIWSFDGTSATYTDASLGCRTSMTYTTSGTKLNTQLTFNSCGQDPVGTRDEITWSVANDKLTLVKDGQTLVFHKVSGSERVLGSWNVFKVDGQPLAQDAAMSLFIYGNRFEIVKLKSGATQPCMTTFAMQNTGSALNVEVVDEQCGDIEVGTTGAFTWSYTGNTLTLSTPGLTLEAVRR